MRYTYKEVGELYEEFINSSLEFRDFIIERYKDDETNASIALFSYLKANNKTQYNKYVSMFERIYQELEIFPEDEEMGSLILDEVQEVQPLKRANYFGVAFVAWGVLNLLPLFYLLITPSNLSIISL